MNGFKRERRDNPRSWALVELSLQHLHYFDIKTNFTVKQFFYRAIKRAPAGGAVLLVIVTKFAVDKNDERKIPFFFPLLE